MTDSFTGIKAHEVASNTRDAYSFDFYGYDEWFKITCFLFNHGYSAAGVEEILRSKHMRWCRDEFEDPTLKGFEQYFAKYTDNVTQMAEEGI